MDTRGSNGSPLFDPVSGNIYIALRPTQAVASLILGTFSCQLVIQTADSGFLTAIKYDTMSDYNI
jgi:hypothetical protein